MNKAAVCLLVATLLGCGSSATPDQTGTLSQTLESGITDGEAYWLTAQISGFRLSVCHNNFNEGGELCQNVPSLASCAQRWRIDPVPGVPGYYWLTSLLTTYRLDVLHANTDNGGPICQAKPNPTDAQQWLIEDVPGEPGYYRLTAKNSKLRLDVYGGNTDDNGRVCQAAPNDTASQKWHLEPPSTSEVCEHCSEWSGWNHVFGPYCNGGKPCTREICNGLCPHPPCCHDVNGHLTGDDWVRSRTCIAADWTTYLQTQRKTIDGACGC